MTRTVSEAWYCKENPAHDPAASEAHTTVTKVPHHRQDALRTLSDRWASQIDASPKEQNASAEIGAILPESHP
jgi:hypothetical protein